MEKKCTKCGETKPLEEFSKRKRNKSGYHSSCKVCTNAYHKQYNLNRYGKQTTPSTLRWREANRDKVAEMQKKADLKRYNEPKRVSQRLTGRATRRAVKLQAPSESWSRIEVFEEANGRCLYCGVKVDYADMHADHFIPLAKGGTNLRDNIVCSCASCNTIKNAKLPQEFISPNLIGGSK